MGQVSFLEDIDERLQNLEHESGRTIPPTDAAVRSQQKRLEKEQARLRALAKQLLSLAKEVKSSIDDPKMTKVKKILNVQFNLSKAENLKAQVSSLEEQSEALGKELKISKKVAEEKKIASAMVQGIRSTLDGNLAACSELKHFFERQLNQDISLLVADHPIAKVLKKQVKETEGERDLALRELDVFKAKVAELQRLLSRRRSS